MSGMCVVDAATKEAAVARFLLRHVRMADLASDHPALLGCTEVDWSLIPGCPPGMPALLHGLLDEAAGPDAVRALENVLLDGVFHTSAVMPSALPFLIRIAAVPDLSTRPALIDLLVLAAELSRSVDSADERQVLLFGADHDHPERAACRSAFSSHAAALRALVEDEGPPHGLVNADDRACLLAVLEPSGQH
ncbi:hypothetical protein [Streptomyces sp. NPDC059491]|uniref:hypothetical protein n=1 Tax=Streptomyces sp. NPDC059491 TaxID=3346850 RepID=UPI0036A5426C